MFNIHLCCRFRWRLVPHLQPQWGKDQIDGQHLPEVLQGAAGARCRRGTTHKWESNLTYKLFFLCACPDRNGAPRTLSYVWFQSLNTHIHILQLVFTYCINKFNPDQAFYKTWEQMKFCAHISWREIFFTVRTLSLKVLKTWENRRKYICRIEVNGCIIVNFWFKFSFRLCMNLLCCNNTSRQDSPTGFWCQFWADESIFKKPYDVLIAIYTHTRTHTHTSNTRALLPCKEESSCRGFW